MSGDKGMYLRSNFSSPALVRVVGRWVSAPAPASGQDVAERLGQWLGVADVIALRAAHQAIAAPGPAHPGGARRAAIDDMEQELLRVRATLERSIAARDAGATREPDTGYAPYHRRYLDHQRRMAMATDELRDLARRVLAAASPRLAQLAELDAVLERMLGARAQQLLSSVPLLLKDRFEQLRRQQAGDTPDAPPPGAWLDTFAGEFQEALRAELELRLQPVAGMIEALGNEVKQQQ
jgi:hypothetical protein